MTVVLLMLFTVLGLEEGGGERIEEAEERPPARPPDLAAMTLSLPKSKSPAPVMAWASGAAEERRMADATEAVATNLEKGLFFISRDVLC